MCVDQPPTVVFTVWIKSDSTTCSKHGGSKWKCTIPKVVFQSRFSTLKSILNRHLVVPSGFSSVKVLKSEPNRGVVVYSLSNLYWPSDYLISHWMSKCLQCNISSHTAAQFMLHLRAWGGGGCHLKLTTPIRGYNTLLEGYNTSMGIWIAQLGTF